MGHIHTAVWIDHQEAHIFRVEKKGFGEVSISAPTHVPRHPQRQAQAHNHPDDEPRFFHDVAQALRGAAAVLIVGPSTAKLHLRDYLLRQPAESTPRIAGVEAVDHPTDKQLAAYVRKYFATGAGTPAHAS